MLNEVYCLYRMQKVIKSIEKYVSTNILNNWSCKFELLTIDSSYFTAHSYWVHFGLDWTKRTERWMDGATGQNIKGVDSAHINNSSVVCRSSVVSNSIDGCRWMWLAMEIGYSDGQQRYGGRPLPWRISCMMEARWWWQQLKTFHHRRWRSERRRRWRKGGSRRGQ